MTLRQQIGKIILLSHIRDSYWVPNENDPYVGTGYFQIDYKWYRIAERISGQKPEELMKL